MISVGVEASRGACTGSRSNDVPVPLQLPPPPLLLLPLLLLPPLLLPPLLLPLPLPPLLPVDLTTT